MEVLKFQYYEQKPCKFILRSGKQIFGIVWEDNFNNSKKYFFSSAVEYMKAKLKSREELKKTAYPISIEDVIHAELL